MARLCCPFCRAPFTAPGGAEVICPNPSCGQRLRTPAEAEVEAIPAVVASAAATFLIDVTRLARLRVWAALVRDRRGLYSGVSPQASELARTLCGVLDTRAAMMSDGARSTVDDSVARLVGMIVLAGAAWIPD